MEPKNNIKRYYIDENIVNEDENFHILNKNKLLSTLFPNLCILNLSSNYITSM